MKKFLLSLLCIVATITSFAATLEVTPANMKVSNSSTSYVTSEFQFASGEFNFKANQVNPSTGQMKVKANGANGFNLYNTTAIPSIKSVTLTADQTTLGTWHMKISNSAAVTGVAGSSDIQGIVDDKNKNVMTFMVPVGTDASYFHINLTANGSGAVKFTKIEIEYGVTGPQDATITYEKATYEAYVGTLFSAPEYTTESNGAVTYVSSNPEIATVAENGDVTPLKIGTTTIIATAAATAEFNEATGSYVLNVNGSHPGIKFNGESNYIVNLGDEFVSPALVNPNNVDVIYESSNSNVANVDQNGNVTVLNVVGRTTISAIFEGNSEYAAASAEYTISVIDPNAIAPAMFIFAGDDANVSTLTTTTLVAGNSTVTSSRAENDMSDVVLTKDEASMVITWEKYINDKGTETEPSHSRYWSNAKTGLELRFYTYNTLKISVTEGYKIDRITFTKGGGATWNLAQKDEDETAIAWPEDAEYVEWTPIENSEVSSAEFITVSGRTDIGSIKVEYSKIVEPEPELTEHDKAIGVEGYDKVDVENVEGKCFKIILKHEASLGHNEKAEGAIVLRAAKKQQSEVNMRRVLSATEEVSLTHDHESLNYTDDGKVEITLDHMPEQGDYEMVIPAGFFLVGDSNVSKAQTIGFNVDAEGNGTTGLAEISADKAAAIYDLQGRKVSRAGRGLFIQGGKVVRM